LAWPVKRPARRVEVPPRNSDNDKRRLLDSPDGSLLVQLASRAKYRGSAKHKLEPLRFGPLYRPPW